MSVKRRELLSAATRVSFLPRYISAGLMLCVGLGLSVVASVIVRNSQLERQNALNQKRADQLAASLNRNIDSKFEILRSIGDFYNAAPEAIARGQFSILAKNSLARNKSVQALAWLPLVSNSQRQNYEQAVQAEGFSSFKIVEQQTPEIMVRAKSRPEYFPVSYIEPMQGNEFILGFDFGTEAIRFDALQQARDTGNLAATSRVQLLSNQPGFLVVLPIYNTRFSPNSLQARRENLKGFIVVIFHLSDFVEAVSEELELEAVNFALYDATSAFDQSGLAVYESATKRAIATPERVSGHLRDAKLFCPPLHACTRSLNIANRKWSLSIVPTPQSFSAQKYWLAWSVLIGGSLISGLLATYLLKFQRHATRIEVLVQELEQANFEIRLLSRLSDALQACVTLEEAYNVIPPLVQKLFPDRSGGLYIISALANLVEAAATWGVNLSSQSLFAPNDCWAIRCGREHLFQNTNSGLACQHYSQSLPQECLCVPMMAQGESLGLLYLSSSEQEKLTEAKQQLAVTVAEHIALSLANLKLRETLKHQSMRDPLTSLFNRRYMEEFLERELHRAQRKEHCVGIVMLDVDHFKKFNDTFGHEGGDTLLQELAMFLQGSIRGSDIACRYGGEEFLIILPEASLETTKQRAEQLRQGVKHLQVQQRQQLLGPIALSIGVACFPKHGQSSDSLIQAADAALYKAKKWGRDRVAIAE